MLLSLFLLLHSIHCNSPHCMKNWIFGQVKTCKLHQYPQLMVVHGIEREYSLACSYMIGGKRVISYHLTSSQLWWWPAGELTLTLRSKFKLFQIPQVPITFPKHNQEDMCGVARSDTCKQERQRVMEERQTVFQSSFNSTTLKTYHNLAWKHNAWQNVSVRLGCLWMGRHLV